MLDEERRKREEFETMQQEKEKQLRGTYIHTYLHKDAIHTVSYLLMQYKDIKYPTYIQMQYTDIFLGVLYIQLQYTVIYLGVPYIQMQYQEI